MKPKALAKAKIKILKLTQTLFELESGENYNIIRLTSLKAFCEDESACAQFGCYLLGETVEALDKQRADSYQADEEWEFYQALTENAATQAKDYLESPTKMGREDLLALHQELSDSQKAHKPGASGKVRVIHSRQALLAETALACILFSHQADYWGYRMARLYVERYDSSYGTGLIPSSAPYLRDVIEFWCRHLFSLSLRELVEEERARVEQKSKKLQAKHDPKPGRGELCKVDFRPKLEVLDRTVAIVSAEQPYYDWVEKIGANQQAQLLRSRKDATAYLIPKGENRLEEFYRTIFELELGYCTRNTSLWPKRRGYKTFLRWFHISYHPTLIKLDSEELCPQERLL